MLSQFRGFNYPTQLSDATRGNLLRLREVADEEVPANNVRGSQSDLCVEQARGQPRKDRRRFGRHNQSVRGELRDVPHIPTRSWISATSSLASVVMIAKVRSHSPEVGSFQFSHSPPILHGNGIGLLGSSTPDRLPFEETIDWEYATPPTIGVPKRDFRQ